MRLFAQYLRFVLSKFFIAIGKCFEGAEICMRFGLKVDDFCVYRARYNTKQCIVSESFKLLFDRNGLCLNVQCWG